MKNYTFLEDLKVKHLDAFIVAYLSNKFFNIEFVAFSISPELFGYDVTPELQEIHQTIVVEFIAKKLGYDNESKKYRYELEWDCEKEQFICMHPVNDDETD